MRQIEISTTLQSEVSTHNFVHLYIRYVVMYIYQLVLHWLLIILEKLNTKSLECEIFD
jgi:hypothetical protein